MLNETSVVIFERGALMLAEANTIQKAKELKGLALTAAEWARRKGMGEAAVMSARGYALEAERKMGQMLRESERANVARDRKKAELQAVTPPPTLKALGLTKNESHRAQRLADLPEEKFQAIKAGLEKKSMAVAGAHVSHNTGDNEWYTPAGIIEASLEVLGGIDLDPASTAKANGVVGAKMFFTEKDDGLEQEWRGRVFMNPPYASDLVGKFADKLVAELASKRVRCAIVLVNNSTETRWFQKLAAVATSICLPVGRIKFWHPGKTTATPLQGQAILYFGAKPAKFDKCFKVLGVVCNVVR